MNVFTVTANQPTPLYKALSPGLWQLHPEITNAGALITLVCRRNSTAAVNPLTKNGSQIVLSATSGPQTIEVPGGGLEVGGTVSGFVSGTVALEAEPVSVRV